MCFKPEVNFCCKTEGLQLDGSILPTLVEAKNENIKGSLAQCLAEMIAAQKFNLRENLNLPIYGAVTTGTIWQFLILEANLLCIDLREYYIRDTDKLLAILSHPFQEYLGHNTNSSK